MKYILISLSIIISIVFTSFTNAYANKGAIDSLLNLEFGIEKMEFSLAKIEKKSFKNVTLQTKYESLRQINNSIIDIFNEKYVSGEIDYYAAHGLASEQRQFAYSVQKLFEYLELKIQLKTNDFDSKIIEYYGETKISYGKIVFIYDEARKK